MVISSPDLRCPPELAEHEAGEGVVVLDLEVLAELLVEVVDRERAVHPDRRSSTRWTESSGMSNSSSISPTISSSRSSRVTIPCVEPNSSTTIAMCWFVRRNSVEQRARSLVSGTKYAGRRMSSISTVLDAVRVQRREEIANVQDPDDVVEAPAECGVARVRGVDDRRERLLRRQLDRYADNLGPGHHHVVDLLLGEVEDLVDHLLLRRPR